MPLSPVVRGDDLFFTRRGKTPRARGGQKAAPDRWAPSALVTTCEEGEAERLLDHRQEVIRAMLADHTVEIVFQPIVDLRTGGKVGAEALARFEVPSVRQPAAWFAEAKAIGLGVELEMAAIRAALHQLDRIPSGLYLSLNASPDTIMASEFRATVGDVAAERLVLELTEHESIDDHVLFENAINELRSNGMRLAVDDAGAGFSSFRRILNLHPDVIKLDIGLRRGVDSDPARQALGKALLAFGLDAFDTVVVAEGIETEGEFSTLRRLGCRYGQGFYLGRPSRLSFPNPRLAAVVKPRLTGESGVQPPPTPGVIEVDNGAAPGPSLGSRTDGQHVRQPDGAPISLKEKLEQIRHQREQERDIYDELLDLVAEIQNRSGGSDDAVQGHRSRVRFLLAR